MEVWVSRLRIAVDAIHFGQLAEIGGEQLPSRIQEEVMSTSNHQMRRCLKAAAALALTSSVVVPLSGCLGAGSPTGELGVIAKSEKDCRGQKSNAIVFVDASGSQSKNGSAVVKDQTKLARDTALRTVGACGGQMKVVAFSGSMADTEVKSLTIDAQAGTAEARRRIAQDQISEKLGGLDVAITNASRATPGASSITSQFQIAKDFAEQVDSGDSRLTVVLSTDGIETVAPKGADFTKLSDAEASRLADTADVPRLANAEIRMAGIGVVRTSSGQLRPEAVQALRRYWTRVCARATGSPANCLITTDLTTTS